MLRPLVQRAPGLRSPGSVDPFEMAVRAIVGQQISVAGARTVLGRLTAEHGTPVELPDAGSAGSALPPGEIPQRWQAFPTPDAIAGIDPESLPMPRARGRTIVRVAAAIAGGELALDPGSDRAAARAQLLSLPGIGPWTADYLLMRVVGDPDIYLASDLGVKHALAELGRAAGHAPPGSDIGHRFDADATAPWRSYLTHHLWQSLGTVQQAPKARTDSSSLPIGPTDKDIR
jgi:AraC family transcriptional regulator of adaptative response / DNA-3-methyladenine glycosylase II